MNQKLAVVITGSTGKQGGAVVKALLERGHEVRAVTRNTDSANERELSKAGAKAAGVHLIFTSVARITARAPIRRISKPRVRSYR
jgi:uncharacterized protein YbjT (DUF2867 family)